MYDTIYDTKAGWDTMSATKNDLNSLADNAALDEQFNQDDPLQTFKKQRLNNSFDSVVVVSGEPMQINSSSILGVGPI